MLKNQRIIAIRRARRLACSLVQQLLVVGAVAASAADPPPVPDPLGLGERLALIDYLQQTYHLTPPPGESLEQLQARYEAAWKLAQAHTPEGQEADSQHVRIGRLRRLISDRFNHEADPALDEDGLLAELHRLESAQEAQEQARMAALAAGGPGNGPVRSKAAPAGPAAGAPVARAPQAEANGKAPIDIHITTTMEEVADCQYHRSGDHAILMVVIGGDWNGALRGAPAALWATFRNAKEIHQAVAILGHGTGTGIGGISITEHIKKYQDFYETMGGQQPAERIACMFFASCSMYSSEQIGEMRNGLGYYPTYRVAAEARVTMNLAVFLGAVRGIMDQPASTPFRGVYRFGTITEYSGAVGEVGVDGERGNPVNFWVDGAGMVVPGR